MKKILLILLFMSILLFNSSTSFAVIQNGTLHIIEHPNNGDSEFKYTIYVKILYDEKWIKIKEGSGDERKSINLPYTITNVRVTFSGKTKSSWTGTATWDETCEIAYPNIRKHILYIRMSTDYNSVGKNDPYIEINGHQDAFNDYDNGYGYGWKRIT